MFCKATRICTAWNTRICTAQGLLQDKNLIAPKLKMAHLPKNGNCYCLVWPISKPMCVLYVNSHFPLHILSTRPKLSSYSPCLSRADNPQISSRIASNMGYD